MEWVSVESATNLILHLSKASSTIYIRRHRTSSKH